MTKTVDFYNKKYLLVNPITGHQVSRQVKVLQKTKLTSVQLNRKGYAKALYMNH